MPGINTFIITAGVIILFLIFAIFRKRILRISELRYRRLFEAAQDGILIVDFETGIIVDINPFLANLINYSKSEFLQKHLWDLGFLKDVAVSKDKFLELKSKKYIRFENLPLETKDGRLINVEFVSNVYDVGGKQVIQCNIRDITDRIKIAEALAENSAKEKALLSGIGEGVVATDKDGLIIMVNHVAAGILGRESKDLNGKKCWEVITMEDGNKKVMPANQVPIWKALNNGVATTSNDYFFVKPDRAQFPATITTAPVKLNEKIIGAIMVFRDITKEKNIDRSKTEFISLASHQLRTPLSTVGWYAELLLSGDVGKLNKEQKKYVEEIYHGNERMIDLVNSLLDVSRIEMGTFAITPEIIDLKTAAQTVIKDLEPLIEKKKIDLSFECSPDTKILLDHDAASIIFQNLLSNAVKYTPTAGKVFLSVKNTGEEIIITVKDTGYGIPKDAESKIFTKLFRADNVRAKEADGTGLGLYIVKSIVEKTGGKIWFESIEGQGTVFYVKFPNGVIK